MGLLASILVSDTLSIFATIAYRFSISIQRSLRGLFGVALQQNLGNTGPGASRCAGLNVQALLCARQDFVTHVATTLQSPLVHPREHADVGIDAIVDFDDTLVVVEWVKSPDVLLERAFPRNRHRQE